MITATHSCTNLPISETSPLPPLIVTLVHSRLLGPEEKHRPSQVTGSGSRELRLKPTIPTSGPRSPATLPPSVLTHPLLSICPQRQTQAMWPCCPQKFPFGPGTPQALSQHRSRSVSLGVGDSREGRRRGWVHRTPAVTYPPIYLPAWQPACLPFLPSSIYSSVTLSFRLSFHHSPVSLCVRAAHGPHSLIHL